MMHVYKGYTGSAEWDEDDGEYAGRVLGIRHIITFQGATEDEARRSMEETIDAYLESCRANGDEPQTPVTGDAGGGPADRLVRRKAGEIPPATPEHLDELRAAMDGPIDCADIPERTEPGRRVVRDADGRIVKKDGP